MTDIYNEIINSEKKLLKLNRKFNEALRERDLLRQKVQHPKNDTLDDRTQTVLRMRAEGYTYEEIGTAVDCSGEYVRQILLKDCARTIGLTSIKIGARTGNHLSSIYGTEVSLENPDPDIIFKAEDQLLELRKLRGFGMQCACEIIQAANKLRGRASALRTPEAGPC